MEVFTIGIKIKKNNKNFFILREINRYTEDNNKLNFNKFYQENYAIFETPFDIKENILHIENMKTIGYIYFEKGDTYIKKEFLKKKVQVNPISHIFFIEGGEYNVYNNKLEKIDKFFFHRRKGEIGIYIQNIQELGKASFIIYPSKIIDNCFLETVINNINNIFPNAIVDSKGSSIKKGKKINEQFLEDLAEQLIVSDSYSQHKTKKKEILKKDFDISKYSLNQQLENYILEKGGWDNISDDESIPITEKYINYNSKENQSILYMLDSINNIVNTTTFQNIINKYKKKGVKLNNKNIPQKLYQHPIFLELINLYKQLEKYENSCSYTVENLKEKIDIGYDNIKSFTYIYEIHCFLKFKEFMEEIGINFIERLEDKLYNTKTQNIISYEKNHKKGFLEGFLNDSNVRLYFLDKIHSKKMRNYTFWQTNEDYKFLGEQFKKIDKRNGVSPDITVEIEDSLIICDVKFSSFRDYKSQLDFPNPDYFVETLHKYKRILVNGKTNPNPIIIFYPGHITEKNIKDFINIQDMILDFYNIFLFPMYDNSDKLNSILKNKFVKIFFDQK